MSHEKCHCSQTRMVVLVVRMPTNTMTGTWRDLPYPKNSPSGPPLSLGTKQTLEGVHVHGDIG